VGRKRNFDPPEGRKTPTPGSKSMAEGPAKVLSVFRALLYTYNLSFPQNLQVDVLDRQSHMYNSIGSESTPLPRTIETLWYQ